MEERLSLPSERSKDFTPLTFEGSVPQAEVLSFPCRLEYSPLFRVEGLGFRAWVDRSCSLSCRSDDRSLYTHVHKRTHAIHVRAIYKKTHTMYER